MLGLRSGSWNSRVMRRRKECCALGSLSKPSLARCLLCIHVKEFIYIRYLLAMCDVLVVLGMYYRVLVSNPSRVTRLLQGQGAVCVPIHVHSPTSCDTDSYRRPAPRESGLDRLIGSGPGPKFDTRRYSDRGLLSSGQPSCLFHPPQEPGVPGRMSPWYRRGGRRRGACRPSHICMYLCYQYLRRRPVLFFLLANGWWLPTGMLTAGGVPAEGGGEEKEEEEGTNGMGEAR